MTSKNKQVDLRSFFSVKTKKIKLEGESNENDNESTTLPKNIVSDSSLSTQSYLGRYILMIILCVNKFIQT